MLTLVGALPLSTLNVGWETSGPPPSRTHGQAYGWLELTRIDQMIDSYLFETTVVKNPS